MKRTSILKNKKALSDIIANLLLILLGILAAGIVFSVVVNKIQPSLSPQISCLDLKLEQQLTIQKACYNQTNSQIELILKRKPKNTEINSIDFAINYNSGSEDFSCGENCINCRLQNPSSTKTYYFTSTTNTKPNSITLLVEDCILETKDVNEC